MTVELHGAHRPAGRAAALLHRAGDGADPGARHRDAGFPGHLQPPHGLAVLPGVGEVPLPDRVRAGRARTTFPPPAGSDRAGERRRWRTGRRSRDESLLFYAGLLGQQPRSAVALRTDSVDYFEVPVEVEQFVGAWYRLDRRRRCRFEDSEGLLRAAGIRRGGGGRSLGPAVARARSSWGRCRCDQYLDFLPTRTAYAPLRALTRFFSGDELDFEVQLVLDREEVPACELGAEGEQAPRLGWITWVKSACRSSRDAGRDVLRSVADE